MPDRPGARPRCLPRPDRRQRMWRQHRHDDRPGDARRHGRGSGVRHRSEHTRRSRSRMTRLSPASSSSVIYLGVLGFAVLLGLSPCSVAPAGAARTTTGGGARTVQDALLGVTWLADANLASKETFGVRGINADGSMGYGTALDWIRAMNAFDHGKGYLGHNDWMLPTTPSIDSGCSSRNKSTFGYGCSKSAMGSLYYKTLGLHEPDTAVSISNGKIGPFDNFQPYLYWTETIAAKHQQGYRTFSFNTGWAGSNVSKHNMYALPMI